MIEILKTVECNAHFPLQEKLCEIENLYGKYSVHVLCDAFNVPRGTFYNYIKRNKRDNVWYKNGVSIFAVNTSETPKKPQIDNWNKGFRFRLF